MFNTGRANLLFLKPARAGWVRLRGALLSTAQNKCTPYFWPENRWESYPTDNRFLEHIISRKIRRIGLLFEALCVFGPSIIWALFLQIGRD